MGYIYRHAEKTIAELSNMFGAVLVTGARQVGKTTLLEEIIVGKDGITSVSLDDAAAIAAI